MNSVLTQTDTAPLEIEASESLDLANALTITTHEQASAAAEFKEDIRNRIKRVVAFFKEPKSLAQKAHRSLCDKENEILRPNEQALEKVTKALAGFFAEEERKRNEQIRAAEEKARAAEMAKRAAEAEQMRIANEAAAAAAKAEQAALKASGDKQAAELAKKREKERKAADELAAQEMLSAPLAVAIEAPAPLQKVKGASAVVTYRFEIVDASKLPREFLVPDEQAIRKVVNALKDRAIIPGVRVFRNIGAR